MTSLRLPCLPPDPDFEALVAQGLALLPAQAPEWTDHNVSDPGITLIELLAYFTDILLYRLGRIDTPSRIEFLHLLRGEAAGAGTLDSAAVRAAIDKTIGDLDNVDCAVTSLDHERLATNALEKSPWGSRARVRSLAATNLLRGTPLAAGWRPGLDKGHTSIVVFPPTDCPPAAVAELLEQVRRALEPRRLLTHHIHVSSPVSIWLGIRVWIRIQPGVDRMALAADLVRTMNDWQPENGPELADGTLALSEIANHAARVTQVEGVDDVVLLQASDQPQGLRDDAAAIGVQVGLHSRLGRDARLSGLPPLAHERLIRDLDGRLAAIALRPWEVPRIVMQACDIEWVATHSPHGGQR